MAKLTEAYFHFRPLEVEAARLQHLRDQIQTLSHAAAFDAYHREVEIDVQLEIGSLRGWVKLVGRLAVFVGAYGGFWDGIDRLADHGKLVAGLVNQHVIRLTATETDQIYRTERRRGAPGRIRDIARSADALVGQLNELDDATVAARLEEIGRQAQALRWQLAGPEEENYVAQHFRKRVEERLRERPQVAGDRAMELARALSFPQHDTTGTRTAALTDSRVALAPTEPMDPHDTTGTPILTPTDSRVALPPTEPIDPLELVKRARELLDERRNEIQSLNLQSLVDRPIVATLYPAHDDYVHALRTGAMPFVQLEGVIRGKDRLLPVADSFGDPRDTGRERVAFKFLPKRARTNTFTIANFPVAGSAGVLEGHSVYYITDVRSV